MILVGLTGGVATGKSTVAQMFQRCGAFVIDADALAHQLVEPDKPAWRAIVKTFGKTVLNPDRTLNRQAFSTRRLLPVRVGIPTHRVSPAFQQDRARVQR